MRIIIGLIFVLLVLTGYRWDQKPDENAKDINSEAESLVEADFRTDTPYDSSNVTTIEEASETAERDDDSGEANETAEQGDDSKASENSTPAATDQQTGGGGSEIAAPVSKIAESFRAGSEDERKARAESLRRLAEALRKLAERQRQRSAQ